MNREQIIQQRKKQARKDKWNYFFTNFFPNINRKLNFFNQRILESNKNYYIKILISFLVVLISQPVILILRMQGIVSFLNMQKNNNLTPRQEKDCGCNKKTKQEDVTIDPKEA